MEFQPLIEQRYSVRSFADTPVSKEDIKTILEAGRIAPTACNNQPQRIWVVTKKEDLAKIDDGISPCRYGAPVVLIVGYSKDAAAVHTEDYRGNWSYGDLDASIAFTHMMLKATDLGLGTCWVGKFKEAPLHEVFDIPEDIVIISLLPLGYPAEGTSPNERHTSRLPLEQTVTWL